jgi:hypothetical protein
LGYDLDSINCWQHESESVSEKVESTCFTE